MATAQVIPCGSLHCQKSCYSRQLTSEVVSCDQSKGGDYEIVLSDTVLFPEGGGQPDDRGTLNGVDVHRVVRQGIKAVHFTKAPLDVGAKVDIEVDWKRRFDHMQQHSGQHLITAVADREYGYKTKSWYLAIGETNRCFIELDTPTLSSDKMEHIEKTCNELISRGVPMTPQWYSAKDPKLEKVRSRGLPDDFEGSEVRVVEIEGLDVNMCCGTHVSSLGHLQSDSSVVFREVVGFLVECNYTCVKLLYSESKKGSTLLYYIVGNRVLGYVQRAFVNETALNKLLSVGMPEHVEAVEKAQKSSRAVSKACRNQLREIAQLLVYKHLHSDPVERVACVHRDDGDNEFMNIMANGLTAEGITVLVTVGGSKGVGQVLLAGENDLVAGLGPKIMAVLEGKGGGRKGRFQGKVSKLEKRREAEEVLREFVKNQSVL